MPRGSGVNAARRPRGKRQPQPNRPRFPPPRPQRARVRLRGRRRGGEIRAGSDIVLLLVLVLDRRMFDYENADDEEERFR